MAEPILMNGVWQNQPTGSLRQVCATLSLTGSNDSKESRASFRGPEPDVWKDGLFTRVLTCSFAHVSRANLNIVAERQNLQPFRALRGRLGTKTRAANELHAGCPTLRKTRWKRSITKSSQSGPDGTGVAEG